MSQSQCPSNDEFARYAAGKVDSVIASNLEQHIRECTACQNRLAKTQLHDSDGLLGALRNVDPSPVWENATQAGQLTIGDLEDQIGPYRPLEPIGEGGMGIVYKADQREPVRRTVALKVIKAGMDTRQVLARFEIERQALAMMNHPSIARVLDAGTTDSGRSYFAMEFVPGIPITKFCDKHQLSIVERLELFRQVCSAVQHAHQKGIIHRDIKPSNVLVYMLDDRPTPKVIDFGLAKAMGQSLTDKTMFTGHGQVVGTLEYMSPEQAEVDVNAVDTRTDIYSLGVLLYELLTGSTPLKRESLVEAGMMAVITRNP